VCITRYAQQQQHQPQQTPNRDPQGTEDGIIDTIMGGGRGARRAGGFTFEYKLLAGRQLPLAARWKIFRNSQNFL